MADTSKIKIKKGTYYSKTIRITYNDGITPYDLTGKAVLFTVKELDDFTGTDSAALIAVDMVDHFDPTNGLTKLEIPESDTLNLEPGFYKWDIRLCDLDSSNVDEPVNSNTGSCEIIDVVTKRKL